MKKVLLVATCLLLVLTMAGCTSSAKPKITVTGLATTEIYGVGFAQITSPTYTVDLTIKNDGTTTLKFSNYEVIFEFNGKGMSSNGFSTDGKGFTIEPGGEKKESFTTNGRTYDILKNRKEGGEWLNFHLRIYAQDGKLINNGEFIALIPPLDVLKIAGNTGYKLIFEFVSQ